MTEQHFNIDMEVIPGVVARNLREAKKKAVETSRPLRFAESVPANLDLDTHRKIRSAYGTLDRCIKIVNLVVGKHEDLPSGSPGRNSLVISKDMLRQGLDNEDGTVLGRVECELDGENVVSSQMTVAQFNSYLPRYLQEFGDKLMVSFKSNNIHVGGEKEGSVYLNYNRNPKVLSGPEETWLYVAAREEKS